MNIGIAALALALASTLAQAADGRTRDATGPRMAPDPPGGNRSDPPAGRPVAHVSLTADIFYRVLASEIAAQRGMYGTAATTMVGLARDTGDPAGAPRWNSSWRAATCPAPWTRPGWARLSPNDLEASSTELALAAANGQTRGLSQALRNRIDASRDKPAAIGQALAVLSRLNDRRLALRILDESFSDGVRKLPAATWRWPTWPTRPATTSARHRRRGRAGGRSQVRTRRPARAGVRFQGRPAARQTEARAYIARNPNARKVR